MDEIGKLPPQAIDLEEAVLGALLLEQNAFEKVNEILSENSFYTSNHAKIFKAIKYLFDQGQQVDLLTVTDRLNFTKELDNIGGPLAITLLTNRVASSAHIENHARIIAQKFIQRELIRVSSKIQYNAFNDEDPMESFKIWDDLVLCVDKITGSDSLGRNISEVVKDSVIAYEKRAELFDSGELAGIPSFSGAINDHTNGWQGGKLIIVAGRPGSGKTAYSLSEAKAASLNGFKPCYFSLEMGDISLTDRLLIAEAEGMDSDGIDENYSYKFRKGCLAPHESERLYLAYRELSKLNLFIDDRAGCNVNYISKVAKNRHKKGLCDMVIIDYLQLLTGSGKKQVREQEVSEMTRGLKLLSKELNIPVVLLAQLNREVEKRLTKMPIMADLRESGSIEQDADIIIFPFRPKYYIDQEANFEQIIKANVSSKYEFVDWNKTAIMIFAKDRDNGPNKILVEVNKSCTTWSDTVDYKNAKLPFSSNIENINDGFESINFEKDDEPF